MIDLNTIDLNTHELTGEELGELLLASVKQMKAGEVSKTHQVTISDVTQARQKVGLSQAKFAQLLGVSVRTLQAWEQGRG